MEKKILSVFVDESGIVNEPVTASRFYVLTFVLHDQSLEIDKLVTALDRDLDTVGIANLCFHAGPIIHANDRFEFMNWDLRRKIFTRMMGFARRVPFKYHCLAVDKKFCDTISKLMERLGKQLTEFVDAQREGFDRFDTVKVYYDCGQKTITNFLHAFFEARNDVRVEFAQAVQPRKYKLFQVADLVCTLHLIEMKIASGVGLSRSESRFFGGLKKFKHNILRYIKAKEI